MEMKSQLAKNIGLAMQILREDGVGRFFRKLYWRIFVGDNFAGISRAALNEINKSEETVRFLVRGVAYVYETGVSGDIAEFGTMSGRSAVALAVAANRLNSDYRRDPRGTKKVWFFDSFEGLPDARFSIDKNSQLVATGIWGKGSCKGLNETAFRKLISRYLNNKEFYVFKGWFKDTVPAISANQKFSMLHIDGDLYESAIDVLDSLFQRQQISNGAIIFFDDWNCNAADQALGERRAWQEVCDKFKIIFSDEGAYNRVCHKFIVHSYSRV